MSGSLVSLAVFLGLCFATASSGAFFRPGAWYESLRKPSWRPPNRLFPPVWTVLYILIAVSGWLVWRERGGQDVTSAMTVYGVQLVLNFLWSAFFFGMRRMDWALVDIALLWLSILVLVALFWPVSPLAALLLLPYLAWVSFAAYLNLTMLRLNAEEGTA